MSAPSLAYRYAWKVKLKPSQHLVQSGCYTTQIHHKPGHDLLKLVMSIYPAAHSLGNPATYLGTERRGRGQFSRT